MLLLALLQACATDESGPHALSFDGAPDCGTVDLTDAPPTTFTVETWLRGDPDAYDDARPFVVWRGVFELSETDNGQVIFTVGPDGVGASHPFTVMDGVLHHVAGTYDGADGTVRLFVDGAQVGVGGTPAFVGDSPDDRVQVGCSNEATEGFFGVLDEVRVSSTLRYTDDFAVPTEIFKNDDDTFMLFHFDEGVGTVAASADGAYSMELTGTAWVDSPLGGKD